MITYEDNIGKQYSTTLSIPIMIALSAGEAAPTGARTVAEGQQMTLLVVAAIVIPVIAVGAYFVARRVRSRRR